MTEQVIINSENNLSPSEDFAFLKNEGLRLIEKLSGKKWNDYNTHDPGITLLEAFCYALTDLGYRTLFDIKDILTPKNLKALAEKQFYTAAQILPVNPVTLVDYRKLILDTKGVRNAWIEVSDNSEIPVYMVVERNERGGIGQHVSLTYDARKGVDVLDLRGLFKVYVEYENNILQEKGEEKVAEVIRNKLRFHRNLCEDFISVSSIEYELFAIDAILQVREGVDVEKINAQVYETIYHFFSPPVSFYSLEQMLEKGYLAEEVFEGPILKYGFIDTHELEKSERYKEIHLSDIISRISDIEGVIAVKKLALPSESDSPFSEFTEWFENVKAQQKAFRLDIEKSQVTFVRSGDRYRDLSKKQADKKRVKALFSFLQSTTLQSKLKGLTGDFQIPVGEYMNIAEYFPLQGSLPEAYKTSEKYFDDDVNAVSVFLAIRHIDNRNSLDKLTLLGEAAKKILGDSHKRIKAVEDITADEIVAIKNEYRIIQLTGMDKGKKQALQLRGFLMLFEQIMADYLSQLSNVGSLLALSQDPDSNPHQTHFPKALQGIKDAEHLFLDYEKYQESLLKITETEDEFLQRKNNLLDHLIARFSESFEKYSNYVHSSKGRHAGPVLIAQKAKFLKDYIQISNYRGKGFDYGDTINTGESGWNSSNVEGFKKRICMGLGIDNYSRQSIAPANIAIKRIKLDNEVRRWIVTLTDTEDDILLETIDGFETEGEAIEILNYILEHGYERDLYTKEVGRDKSFYQLNRKATDGTIVGVAKSPVYRKGDDEKTFDRILEVLSKISEYENFHVLEHILLRPKMPPRQRGNKKSGSQEDSDVVRLLPALPIPAEKDFAKTQQYDAPYRFNIVNTPDPVESNRIRWRLSLIKDDNTEILKIDEVILFYKDLSRRIENIRELAADESNYELGDTADGYYSFSIMDKGVIIAVSRKNYRRKEDAQLEIRKLVEFFSFENEVAVKETNQDDISDFADPYSLQVSIFIPNWPARFRDPTFKHMLEKTIYLETPAHIYPHVYWLDHSKMKQFEEAYKLWIQEFTTSEIPNTEVVNNLILVLNEVRIHP